MKYIFIDFEMHPIDSKYSDLIKISRQEIIEFGAVMLDENYNEVSSFKEYVRPQYVSRVSNSISRLTGISTTMLAVASNFESVLEKFLNWCELAEDDFTIYAWSENDLAQIKHEMKLKQIEKDERIAHLIKNWIDFQKQYCKLVKSRNPISLEHALCSIGYFFKGQQHDALYDARNTADLFIATRDKKEFFKIFRSDLIATSEESKQKLTFTLGDLFNFQDGKFINKQIEG